MNTNLIKAAKFAFLALSFAPALTPQITKTANVTASQKEEEEGEVQHLSVFTVTGSKDDSYYASQTTMGGRTAKDQLEISSTILVAPRQLIEDLAPQMGKDFIHFVAPGVKSNT